MSLRCLSITDDLQVGAFGFLAGATIERDGLPNAGLYDQRAVLQWIQEYIALVGGDKTEVSAWGQSAGAGSIMHHLTAFGGKQNPLFRRTFIQSPVLQFKFDRKGDLEATFQEFSSLAGCSGEGIACLRATSPESLDKANVALDKSGYTVGPSADGSWIRQLAAVELAQGGPLLPLPSSKTTKRSLILAQANTILTSLPFFPALVTKRNPSFLPTS